MRNILLLPSMIYFNYIVWSSIVSAFILPKCIGLYSLVVSVSFDWVVFSGSLSVEVINNVYIF